MIKLPFILKKHCTEIMKHNKRFAVVIFFVTIFADAKLEPPLWDENATEIIVIFHLD